VLTILSTAYAPAPSLEEWLSRVVHACAPHLDEGLGVHAYLFDLRETGRAEYVHPMLVGGTDEWRASWQANWWKPFMEPLDVETRMRLNGSTPLPRNGGTPDDPSDDTEEPFVLELPRAGFGVDVVLLDPPDDRIDRSSLSLTATAPMGMRGAGAELVDRLRFEEGPSLGVARARWLVGPEEAAPEGEVTFTLRAQSASGATHRAELTIHAVTLTPERDPFDRPMVWLFRTDTDFYSTQRAADGGLVSVRGPNGTPDLVEELALLGAQGPDEEANARYLAWIEDALTADVYRYYGMGPDGTPHDDIAFTIHWQGRPGAPDPSTFDPDGTMSMMRFGGSLGRFLGFSGIAPYNEGRIDDTTPERGVATATLIGTLLSTSITAVVLAPLDPERGQPVGTHPADAEVLSPDFDPYAAHAPDVAERYATLRRIAYYLALTIGSVTAHEMGHAMGLMPNGVPPVGFFGGVLDVAFVDPANTDLHHADLPGLNLMQAGGGFAGVVETALASLELPRDVDLLRVAEILALENRLDAYSRAYLQRRLTHGSTSAMPSGLRVACH
jgi:hypothetical protein